MKHIYLMIICVTAFSWMCLAEQDGPATRPSPSTNPAAASGPYSTTGPVNRLGPLIRTIRQAGDARTAIAAYARGCAIDRNKAELHDAYMRRMLKFGLTQIASYPARVLIRLDPNNGLAWGVVGYIHGERGELTKALSATINSLERLRDNPSVLHNAGQLVGWYDSESNPPKITDGVLLTLARFKKELAGKKPYIDAYNAVKAVSEKRRAIKTEFDDKILIAKAELKRFDELAKTKRNQYNDLVADIKSRRKLRTKLRRELHSLEADPDKDYTEHRRCQNLRHLIRDADLAIIKLDREITRMKRRVKRIMSDRRREKTALEKLRRESSTKVQKIEIQFRWIPPAVDGVVTPKVDVPPVATRPTSLPSDPEARARRRLELAGLYLRNGINDKAIKILHGIISDYGSTKAAAEAKRLLASISPTTQPRDRRKAPRSDK